MVTENGEFRYPPRSAQHDIPSRRKIPNPPRLDPLRINPPSPTRPSTADAPRRPPAHRRPPAPRSPRRHPPPPRFPDDPFSRPVSPQVGVGGDRAGRMPTYRAPPFPVAPHDRRPNYPGRDRSLEPPAHRKTPPRQPRLRTSMSSSKLRGKRPKPPNDQGLLPRSIPNGSPDAHADSPLRSSVNSAMTSQSSFEHNSSTERSSVLTKSSSLTDLSPDTPGGPFEKDEGMSVEDAISMYLDGFSDVTEEPGSPDLYGEPKQRPWSPPAEISLDDLRPAEEAAASDKDLPSLPPFPEAGAPDRSPQEEQFLGETNSDTKPQEESLDARGIDPPRASEQAPQTVVIPGSVPPPLVMGTESRDRYGFRKTSHHVTAQMYEAWNGPYAESMAAHRVKWAELLRGHGLPTNDPTIFPPKCNKVKRFVRKGIPPEHRGAAWFFYAGGYDLLQENPGVYDRLVEQTMGSPTNDDKEHIERDLHRTFPDNVHFKPESADSAGGGNPGHGSVTVETEMIQSLRRVLYAFALHSPQVGYTQSLNFITGMLLLFLPEEKAFWMLHIITSVYLPGTHEISLEGANIDLWILMVLLRDSAPQIYNKITGSQPGRHKAPPPLTVSSRLPDITLGLTNWLMSVFIGTLPVETTLRVWDVFFYEGSKTFFRVALAIFKACEKDILAVSDPMEVFQVVQAVPKRLLDANTLVDDCFVRRHRFGQGRIDELRNSRRAAVRQEKLRRSQAFSKGHLQAATDEWRTNRARTPIQEVERSFVDSWRHMKHHAFR
ncbi:putative GTPase activating protein (Gyp3) [Aspergillus candidus]|uniref:Putative GTPase activating protein n=1 Tax=Aspergillus candidus TaxID=41067 RepID=A0A2I2FCW3_ASPCN|nr:putative GTPase activating protein [Aspergillus candidus]PLB38483.1 putative GTPase activating protein [Aspergillus candidus]